MSSGGMSDVWICTTLLLLAALTLGLWQLRRRRLNMRGGIT